MRKDLPAIAVGTVVCALIILVAVFATLYADRDDTSGLLTSDVTASEVSAAVTRADIYTRVADLEQRVDVLEQIVTLLAGGATTTTEAPTTTTTQAPTTTLPPTTTTTVAPTTTTTVPPTTTTTAPLPGVTHPAGTYGAISISGKAVKIIGAGIGKTVIRADSLDAIITLTNCSSVEIANLTIQGNYSRTAQKGIYFKGSNPSVYVHDVEIKDVGFCGIINDIGSLLSGTFTNLRVSHIGDFGMQLRQGAANVQVLDSTWSGFASRLYPGHAIYFDDVNGGLIARHTISGLPTASGRYEISGVKVTRESDTPNSGIIVEDCMVSDAVAAVSLPYAKNVLVRRCVGLNIITRGVYFLAGGDNLTLEDCQMTAPVGYLIYPAYGAPTNVTVRRCSAPGSARAYDWGGVAVTQDGNLW